MRSSTGSLRAGRRPTGRTAGVRPRTEPFRSTGRWTGPGRTVPRMAASEPAGSDLAGPDPPDVARLIPLVRRIVAARVDDRATEDDLVQETLARVLAASPRGNCDCPAP